jgi:hypothetical protein
MEQIGIGEYLWVTAADGVTARRLASWEMPTPRAMCIRRRRTRLVAEVRLCSPVG